MCEFVPNQFAIMALPIQVPSCVDLPGTMQYTRDPRWCTSRPASLHPVKNSDLSFFPIRRLQLIRKAGLGSPPGVPAARRLNYEYRLVSLAVYYRCSGVYENIPLPWFSSLGLADWFPTTLHILRRNESVFIRSGYCLTSAITDEIWLHLIGKEVQSTKSNRNFVQGKTNLSYQTYKSPTFKRNFEI